MKSFLNIKPEQRKLFAIGGIGLAITIGILVYALLFDSSGNDILYRKLSLTDKYTIEMRLEKLGIPFSYKGDAMLVPSGKVMQLRMMFAQENIPSETEYLGYQIFDKVDFFGASSFLNNVNLTRALEGEISRTIGMIAGVESARVHIVMPKSDYFIQSSNRTSASVALKLRNGMKLSTDEIQGIFHLVMTSVPNLSIENITIIDSTGKMLKSDEKNDEISNDIFMKKKKIEEEISANITKIVGEFVGRKNVVVNVMTDINFDKEMIVDERYDPDGQVIRSQKSADESDGANAIKNVSVATNVPNSRQQAVGSGRAGRTKSSAITNYEISRSTINKITAIGRLRKISVAVLVDGKYAADENDKQQYMPRSADEINKIRTLVAGTIGFDSARGDKIEVINLQFNQTPNDESKDDQLDNYQSPFSSNSMMTTTIILILAIGGLIWFAIRNPEMLRAVRNIINPKNSSSGDNLSSSSASFPSPSSSFGSASSSINPENRHDGANNQNGNTDSAFSDIRLARSRSYQRLNMMMEEMESEDIVSAIRRIMYG